MRKKIEYLVNKLWFESSFWSQFLLPLSGIYALIIGLRRYAYRFGIFSSWQARLPIIVVGNLTVGGSGKTPLVIWLVKQLQVLGIRVGVVSRGYASKSSQRVRLVNARSLAMEVGDEPLMIYKRTGVPVAVSVSRIQAVSALQQYHYLDVVISDDGLQHYAMKRSLEIVVVDGSRLWGNGYLLPAGPLRESKSRLYATDLVIMHNGTPRAGELLMRSHLSCAINLINGEKRPINFLQKVVAIAGIANPNSFFRSLTQHGVDITRTVIFSDHNTYSLEQICALTTENQHILMTEKDAVKCKPFALPNWWYAPLITKLSQPDSKLLLARVMQVINGR